MWTSVFSPSPQFFAPSPRLSLCIMLFALFLRICVLTLALHPSPQCLAGICIRLHPYRGLDPLPLRRARRYPFPPPSHLSHSLLVRLPFCLFTCFLFAASGFQRVLFRFVHFMRSLMSSNCNWVSCRQLCGLAAPWRAKTSAAQRLLAASPAVTMAEPDCKPT